MQSWKNKKPVKQYDEPATCVRIVSNSRLSKATSDSTLGFKFESDAPADDEKRED